MNGSNNGLTYHRRRTRQRGVSRFTHAKSGRGRDFKNNGSGIGGWRRRNTVHSTPQVNSSSVDGIEEQILDRSISTMLHDSCPQDETSQLASQVSNNTCLGLPIEMSPVDNTAYLSSCIDQNAFSQIITSCINSQLPANWTCMVVNGTVNVFLLSVGTVKAIQRQIVVDFSGSMDLYVHSKLIRNQELDNIFYGPCHEVLNLTEKNLGIFSGRVLNVVSNVKLMKVCSGVCNEEFKPLWEVDMHGYVDFNPYLEESFTKTYRSHDCLMLTYAHKGKCSKCSQMHENLKRKLSIHASGIKPHTSNIYLTDQEKMKKLQVQQVMLKRMKSKVHWLEKKLEACVQSGSVCFDKDIDDFLSEIALLYVNQP